MKKNINQDLQTKEKYLLIKNSQIKLFFHLALKIIKLKFKNNKFKIEMIKKYIFYLYI